MQSLSPTISLGSIDAIPVGQGRCYIVDDTEIAVFRQRDGRLFATENRCPHRGGPLSEGICGGGKVICPLHAHKFDLATGAGSERDEHLKTYSVVNHDGELLLIVPSDAVS